ncbi:MAG: glycosyltransferase family 39 protein [Candidatus Sumerlaea chitinivorans]|nr:glycosyltransferase family 39 protein [Candidatus Sumerlaea chitinivorans]
MVKRQTDQVPQWGTWVASGGVALAAVAALSVVVWAQWPLRAAVSQDQADAHVSVFAALSGAVALLAAFFRFLGSAWFWKIQLAWLLWFVATVGWGSFILQAVGKRRVPCNSSIIAFAVGFLGIGLFVFLYGQVPGALSPHGRVVLLTLLLVGGLACRLTQRSHWVRPFGCFRACFVRWKRADWITRLAWLFILLTWIWLWMYALTPPIQSDGLRYHLGAPQEYLKRGKIAHLPLNAFSNFPFLPEMHFLLALAAGVPETAQLMHLTAFILCVLAAHQLTGFACAAWLRYVTPRPSLQAVRWLPAFLFTSVPAFGVVSAWPFIDQFVTLFLLLGFYALFRAFEGADVSYFAIAGLMIGGALGSKYTSLAFCAIFGFLAVAELGISFGLRDVAVVKRLVRGLLLAGVVALFAGSAWYIRNTLVVGNPIYPLGISVFGGRDFTSENAALYARKMAEKGFPKEIGYFLRAPWDATFSWTRFERHFPGGALLFVTIAGVTGWGLASVASARRQARFVFYCGWAGLAATALWFFTYQSNRMLGPSIALFIPCATATVCLVSAMSPHLRRVVLACAFLVGAHGILWTIQYVSTVHRPPAAYYFKGAMSRDEYIGEALNYYRAFQYLNEHVPPGERVLLIGEHRIFYAKFDAVWSDWFDTPAVLHLIRQHRVQSVSDLIHALDHERIRWIFVNDLELAPQFHQYWLPRFRDHEWRLVEGLLESAAYERALTVSAGRILHRIQGVKP